MFFPFLVVLFLFGIALGFLFRLTPVALGFLALDHLVPATDHPDQLVPSQVAHAASRVATVLPCQQRQQQGLDDRQSRRQTPGARHRLLRPPQSRLHSGR